MTNEMKFLRIKIKNNLYSDGISKFNGLLDHILSLEQCLSNPVERKIDRKKCR